MDVATALIASSRLPRGTVTHRVPCPLPSGLTLVAPPSTVLTIEHELKLRSVAAGLLMAWIEDTLRAGLYVPYSQITIGGFRWRDDHKLWCSLPMICWTGWTARGAREDAAVLMAESMVQRAQHELPTIVATSVDPYLLQPRWPADEIQLDMMRTAPLVVRVSAQSVHTEQLGVDPDGNK